MANMKDDGQAPVVTIVIEINGQQKRMVDRLTAGDPGRRGPQELVRAGFLEYARTLLGTK